MTLKDLLGFEAGGRIVVLLATGREEAMESFARRPEVNVLVAELFLQEFLHR